MSYIVNGKNFPVVLTIVNIPLPISMFRSDCLKIMNKL